MKKTDIVLGIIGATLMVLGLPIAAIASRVSVDPTTPLAVWCVLGFMLDLAILIHVRVDSESFKSYSDSIYRDYVGDYTGQTYR